MGDQDNTVHDTYEQEFEIEELYTHEKYASKSTTDVAVATLLHLLGLAAEPGTLCTCAYSLLIKLTTVSLHYSILQHSEARIACSEFCKMLSSVR